MTITGTGFLAGATVTFGGTAATNVSGGEQHDDHGDDAGAWAGAVTVTVTVNGQSGTLTNGYT